MKTYKDVASFSKEVLKLDDYESWLVTTKNKMIALIVKARKKKSISQKELAKTLGTTQSVISRIENGTTQGVTLDYLVKIASTLGITADVKLKDVA